MAFKKRANASLVARDAERFEMIYDVAEKITPSVEEMAQKLREKVRERISQKQKTTPAPAVKTKIDWSPVHSPSHRQGRGIGL